MRWPIAIPCIFFFGIVLSIYKVIFDMARRRGSRPQGQSSIIIGYVAMGVGNMIQIIPGNMFPWDTLAGIVFATLLIHALCRRRMFRMTLLISRSVLVVMSVGLCFLSAVFFVAPLESAIAKHLQLPQSSTTAVVVVLFALLIAGIYAPLERLIGAIFSREEQKNRLLKNFSQDVANLLNTREILDKLVHVIREEVSIGRIYVCLAEKGRYALHYKSNALDPLSFSIGEDSAYINFLRQRGSYFLMAEFRGSPLYLPVWESEKELFKRLGVQCVLALRDGEEIVGIILLSAKERGGAYTPSDLEFLDTVGSIASIAMKNAVLYERVYKEARTDSLTGLYNYKYFIEKVEEEFAACGADNLALIYLDLDDLKLYNQLYGAEEGDWALKKVAELTRQATGEAGMVFRHSGKVFAILLPRYDARRAYQLACDIQERMRRMDRTADKRRMKALTVSGGICVAPAAAGSVKELIENADLAVFNAKNSGKGKINVFRAVSPRSQAISDRALEIIGRAGRLSGYSDYSATVFALTAAIDAKDHYTYNHSRNVAYYSIVLATAVGMNDEQVRLVYEAALLHDIGKISVPEHILSKPGELSHEEYEVMKSHVDNCIEMIRHLPSMDYVIPVAVGHHERWDGKGYPRGIAGEAIPLGARVLAVADAFDAMTNDRPYRKAISFEQAARQIELGAGQQFDPALAERFVELIRGGELGENCPEAVG